MQSEPDGKLRTRQNETYIHIVSMVFYVYGKIV